MPVQVNGIPWPLSPALGTVLLSSSQSLEREKRITPVVFLIIAFFRFLHMKILLQSSAGEHGNIFVTWIGPQMENLWHCLKWQQFYAAAQAERLILSQVSECELKRWNCSLCPGAPWDAEVSSVLILREHRLLYHRSLDFCLSCWNLYFVCICSLYLLKTLSWGRQTQHVVWR